MKYIFLLFIAALELFGGLLKSPLIEINKDASEATIKVDKVDVGVSGFIVHEVAKEHTIILKNVVVKSFDEKSKIAKLEISEFGELKNNALPVGKWDIKVGDIAVLAFGYTRICHACEGVFVLYKYFVS